MFFLKSETFSGYDDLQNKDYQNYNAAAANKVPGANASDMNLAYQKSMEKSQSNPGYHTPPPPQAVYSNPIMNAPHGLNLGNSNSNTPQYALITPIVGAAPNNTPLIQPPVQQDNMNARNLQNASVNNMKQQMNKSGYPNSSWS